MQRLTTLEEWGNFARDHRARGSRVALVPTMGALHAGHEALMRAAARDGDVVIVTSFVNPLQFSDPTDLARYPSTPTSDDELASRAGVAAIVRPSVADMWPAYPDVTPTVVSVRGLGEVLEGRDRPGHFDGVATVVAKLLHVTGPCRVYFGEKDYQQLMVIRQLVKDLAFDATVEAVATVRDEDGLALSSRNVRLSAEGRRRALGLVRALRRAQALATVASELRDVMATTLGEAGVHVAYADVVATTNLAPLDDHARGPARLVIAGEVEGVRLIDNDEVQLKGAGRAVSH